MDKNEWTIEKNFVHLIRPLNLSIIPCPLNVHNKKAAASCRTTKRLVQKSNRSLSLHCQHDLSPKLFIGFLFLMGFGSF